MYLKKKSQVATEFLVIMGIVIVILIPAGYILLNYESSSSDSITAAKIDKASSEIIQSVNNLYTKGIESKTIMEIDIPEGVQSISFQNNEVIFTYLTSKGNSNEIAKVANANLIGETILNPVPGIKKLEIINKETVVCITTPELPCQI